MTIEYGDPARVHSIRIPDKLWDRILTYSKTHKYGWQDNVSNTIRDLITYALEHLEEPIKSRKKKKG